MKVRVGRTGVSVGRGVAVSVEVGIGVSVGPGAKGPTEQANKKRRGKDRMSFFMALLFLWCGNRRDRAAFVWRETGTGIHIECLFIDLGATNFFALDIGCHQLEIYP